MLFPQSKEGCSRTVKSEWSDFLNPSVDFPTNMSPTFFFLKQLLEEIETSLADVNGLGSSVGDAACAITVLEVDWLNTEVWQTSDNPVETSPLKRFTCSITIDPKVE